MLKHSELMARRAFVDHAGLLWAILPDGSLQQVTYPGGVNLEYRNLINSALMLYNVNAVVGEGVRLIGEWAEETGNDRIISAVMAYEANLNLARRVAIEGLEKVAALKKDG